MYGLPAAGGGRPSGVHGAPPPPLLVELHVVTVVSVISSGLRHRSSFARHLHVEVWAWVVLGQSGDLGLKLFHCFMMH